MNILIAEDDIHLGQGLTALLEHEGYDCTLTNNGSEAYKAYKEQRPDFCIFDVMMPEMDGFELCRLVRSVDETIPIILLTAKGDEIDRVIGLELGADDYITKPFGSLELVARLKAIQRRVNFSKDKQSTPFKMHHLTIDPQTMRATFSNEGNETSAKATGNDTVPLTLRELKVLQMLYQNKGTVLSKQDIFEECWGRRYMTNSRALDQFISQLRQKIEPGHQAPDNSDQNEKKIIQTVHGVGYRYEE